MKKNTTPKITKGIRQASAILPHYEENLITYPCTVNFSNINGNESILPVLAQLELKGFAITTLQTVARDLTHLSHNCKLDNIKETLRYIISKPIVNRTKNKLFLTYEYYLNYYKIPHEPLPYLKTQNKEIRVPLTSELNTLITGSKSPLSLKLMLSKETGMRPIEVVRLLTKNVDFTKRKVYPITAKYGAGRSLTISQKLTDLLEKYITKRNRKPNERVFKTTSKAYGTTYRRSRKRTADKLGMPQLNTIRLYDFRHYFGSELYRKTHSLVFVQRKMGHKDIASTLIYVHINDDEEPTNYTTAVAESAEQARKLIENGFEKADSFDDIHIYKRRK